jgi:hypothetical protein
MAQNGPANGDDNRKCKTLRSASNDFDWKENCFICRQQALYDFRHPDRTDIIMVESLELKGRMTQICIDRGDKLADEVSCRLRSCIDLVAVEARYHRNCSKNFSHNHVQNKKCRPLDSAKEDAFNKMCEWLEITDHGLLMLAELNESVKQSCKWSPLYVL